MLFSIIVPAYNCEEYLDECVQSVLEQSFYDWELIIVDDGSTDSTSSICDALALKYGIKVIHEANRGASTARNVGIDSACGKYVVFLDSDDRFGVGYLQGIADAIELHPSDIFLGCLRTDFGKGSELREVKLFDSDAANLLDLSGLLRYFFGPADDAPFAAWHNVYLRDFLNNHELRFDADLVWSEDRDFVLRILATSPSFWCIAVQGYQHRVDVSTSVTGIVDADKIVRAMICDERWLDKADINALFSCAKPFLSSDYIHLAMRSLQVTGREACRVRCHILEHPDAFENAFLGHAVYLLIKKRASQSIIRFVSNMSRRGTLCRRKRIKP